LINSLHEKNLLFNQFNSLYKINPSRSRANELYTNLSDKLFVYSHYVSNLDSAQLLQECVTVKQTYFYLYNRVKINISMFLLTDYHSHFSQITNRLYFNLKKRILYFRTLIL